MAPAVQNEALAAYDRAREVLGMIGDANPTLLSVTRDRAWIDAMTAGILIEAARDAEALPVLERARKARETLVKAGTSVIRDQTQLIRIHSQIAGIHARAGRTSQALASREPAVAVATRLADAHPGDLGIQAELAPAYLDIADLLTTTGKPSEALPWCDKALAIQRKMVEAELSRAPGTTLPTASGAAGSCSRSAAGPPRRSRPSARPSPSSRGWPTRHPATSTTSPARQSLLSGVAPDAGSGLTAADGQAEADKAMKSLRRAVAAGWKRAGPHEG